MDKCCLSIVRAMRASLGLLAVATYTLPAFSAGAVTCTGGDSPMRQVELFFGTAIKGRGPVTARAWRRFLAAEVTSRFPAGLTIFEARGQWRGKSHRIVRENSHVLVLLYKPSQDAETQIDAIRTTYQKRFDQDSVMRVESEACVSF
jgi:hypothetical protein